REPPRLRGVLGADLLCPQRRGPVRPAAEAPGGGTAPPGGRLSGAARALYRRRLADPGGPPRLSHRHHLARARPGAPGSSGLPVLAQVRPPGDGGGGGDGCPPVKPAVDRYTATPIGSGATSPAMNRRI